MQTNCLHLFKITLHPKEHLEPSQDSFWLLYRGWKLLEFRENSITVCGWKVNSKDVFQIDFLPTGGTFVLSSYGISDSHLAENVTTLCRHLPDQWAHANGAVES